MCTLLSSYQPVVDLYVTLCSPHHPAADPLLLECATDGSRTHVTIDCRSNRPPVTTMCSFDGGVEHQCKWLNSITTDVEVYARILFCHVISRCSPFVFKTT